MQEKWTLLPTNSINQMLRVRDEKELSDKKDEFRSLVKVVHQYHISDDIMFPDPSCLAFFTAFEQNHLEKLEKQNSLILSAINIHEGLIEFYIYCKDAEKTINDCIDFLKSNSLYSCNFNVVTYDDYKSLNELCR